MTSSKSARRRRRQERAKHLRVVGYDERPPSAPLPSGEALLAEIRDLREELDGGFRHVRDVLRESESQLDSMSGEVLPRLKTMPRLETMEEKRPWWQGQGALALACVLMFVAAVMIGKACHWLGR